MKASQTAVVLIEFQNEFCSEAGRMHRAVRAELERNGTLRNAARLLAAAREKGCLVVHCPFVFDRRWAERVCACGTLADVNEAGAFRPGEWGSELAEPFIPARGEVVLKGKRALSGFTHTQLDHVLAQRGIRCVACAGFLTNVCVESTARSAYDRGWRVVIVKDACGATSRANQEYVENQIAPVLGCAMSVDEFIASLE